MCGRVRHAKPRIEVDQRMKRRRCHFSVLRPDESGVDAKQLHLDMLPVTERTAYRLKEKPFLLSKVHAGMFYTRQPASVPFLRNAGKDGDRLVEASGRHVGTESRIEPE